MDKYKEFKEYGSKGGNKRWSNYKGYLVDEMRKLTTKKELDFYLSLNPTPSELQKAYLELLKRKNERK